MQSWMYDVRVKYRYERREAEQEDGDAVAEYVRGKQYMMSFRQTTNTIEDSETGSVNRVGYRIYVNETHDFVQGDRIGEWDEQEFVVNSVLDNMTGQLLEVSQL